MVDVDGEALGRVVEAFGARWTREAADIEAYLAAQVDDASHREVVGPLLAAGGGSGVRVRWLNDGGRPWPGAPTTGRSARGNGGRHLLWVDPARELVLASHWTEEPLELVRQVSATVR